MRPCFTFVSISLWRYESKRSVSVTLRISCSIVSWPVAEQTSPTKMCANSGIAYVLVFLVGCLSVLAKAQQVDFEAGTGVRSLWVCTIGHSKHCDREAYAFI